MIEFTNKGEIDVRSISTFGVSVKEGDNPIGFFGTGLKYAIAVLLRTGHKVTIFSGLKVYNFAVSVESVRGQDFDFVTMQTGNSEPVGIGFTTELGKQWALWMAYREIACNCKDEKGVGAFISYMPDPEEGVTKIIVQGDEFESVFSTGHLYILADKPWKIMGDVEIRNHKGSSLFYRGVRVMDLQKPGLYTYNVLSKMDLTEDRTLKSSWDATHRIATAVLQSDDESFIRAVVSADNEYYEAGLDFHGWSAQPSDTFLGVVENLVCDRMMKVNQTAMHVWKDHTHSSIAPTEIKLTNVQQKSLEKALDFCGQIGFHIRDAYPIKFVETLGEGGLGLAADQTIFIAERVFHLGGTKQLASTLIEEYLHLRHGWADMTRELQSFLFEKLVSLGEELTGEPL